MPKINTDPAKIQELLTRGVEEAIVPAHLTELLKSGKQLRVKLGIDPTKPDIHLGHTVVLRKLKQFQDAGHQVILIIGDITAQIGDPSGRSEARTILTKKDVKAHAKTYLAQFGKVLDLKKVELRYNSEWFEKGGLPLLMQLMAATSIQRATERDDFEKRIKAGTDVSVVEVLYPLLQGYDSVAIKADVELGGTDQKFNMLMGRRLQRHFGMKEQDVITMPLIEGTDGVRKMSKSFGNYVGITEAPEEMYGKLMATNDNLIIKYFTLLTNVPTAEIAAMEKGMASGENPRDVKMQLAREIVAMYHNAKAASKAEEGWKSQFQEGAMPEDMPEIAVKAGSVSIIELLIAAGFATSKSEARRTVEQGGAKIDGVVVETPDAMIAIRKEGVIMQKGKRYFARIKQK